MRRRLAGAAVLALALALLTPGLAGAAARVASLDQCADQYVIALVPRDRIAGVTGRADDPDAWLRADAGGLPVRRPTAESMLAAGPDVVVRYWGGDQRLMRTLERRGIRVLQIDEATDFAGLRDNLRHIAAGVGEPARGEQLIAAMNADLRAARGAWDGRRALYVTAGGFTAGPGTLVDAVMAAAGMVNAAASPGFAAVSLERLVLQPPRLFVKAFFENRRGDRRGPGRSRVLARLSEGRTAAELPGSLLSCPAWFASEASRRLAEAAPR